MLGWGFRVSGFGFRVHDSGVRVWGRGIRVEGAGCRASGFGVQSLGDLRVPVRFLVIYDSDFCVIYRVWGDRDLEWRSVEGDSDVLPRAVGPGVVRLTLFVIILSINHLLLYIKIIIHDL